MVVLAGCAGGAGTLTESPQSSGASETTSSGSADAGETGTVNFYVSDEENAIGDFEHLNVTIEQVTFVRAEGGEDAGTESEDDDASEDESVDNESVEANASVNVSNDTTAVNATATVDAAAENETESEGDADADVDAESNGKVTYEVDNVTVDLTELKGENATLVDSYDLPKGDYNAVYIEVSEVNGTLETGEQVNIKLPSNKLHITSDFTVASDEDVDFVFDITAFEAGKSGKYILKPVISESGTNVPIKNVDEPDENSDDEAEDEDADDEGAEHETEAEAEAEAETELNVTIDGNVTPGEHVTLVVTQNGSAVENATVTVNDEVVGTTDANGTLDVEIPLTTDLSVNVTHGDAETELEFEFDGEVSKTVEADSEKPEDAGKSDNSTA
ncbi:DUF4382 domain-containing protein [Haloferax sp. MBLA0076]|uniref:DUF4382 domain-containing protein n=1 Tax=Haloferax litoreum TaxID=2666140 RepID=A0A6A8GKF7_9EURY|nr:DUF4382 domain-containing protein [Haloferax sp. CBA1148]MRX23339.1 DUF4382 domain-containing protein [Haloferax litoreum]